MPKAYIEDVLSNYHNVPLPSMTIHAAATNDGALNLYHSMADAMEFCGCGVLALQDVPIELGIDSRILTVTERSVQWTTDGHGSKVDSIRLTCR